MKDKEKQIEEIEIRELARVFMTASCKGSECENCLFIKSVKEAEETCVCLKAVYNAGYRKLPEDSVVLSMDNYNRLKRDSELYEARHEEKLKLFAKAYNQGSKETAEKFYNEFLDFIHNETFRKGYELKKVERKIKELATREGVEIKE